MATQATTLDVDGFMREVTERKLDVKGPSGGYLYAGYQGPKGWEVIRCANNPWYLVQGRWVVTQDNVGGGALTLTVTARAGQILKMCRMYMIGPASAGATLIAAPYDEDGQAGLWGSIGAGASRTMSHPSVGTTASTNANIMSTIQYVLGPGESIRVVASAALQTETLTLVYSMLSNTAEQPEVSAALSGGTPNLAANAISAANAITLVAMP